MQILCESARGLGVKYTLFLLLTNEHRGDGGKGRRWVKAEFFYLTVVAMPPPPAKKPYNCATIIGAAIDVVDDDVVVLLLRLDFLIRICGYH